MARPRTATNVLALRGTFKKNPDRGRARADEPVVTEPLGDPPEQLSAECCVAWDYLHKCAPYGVLTRADRVAFELAAVLFAQFRQSPFEMDSAKIARLNALLGQFGMTPSDRSKVTALQPKKQSRLAEALG